MAVANYTDANGSLPPAFIKGPNGTPWHSWRVLVLPYIEQDALFKAYRFDEPWNGPNNSRLAASMPRTLGFSDHDKTSTTTNYLAVVGAETMWPGTKGRKLADVKDGTSNTILLVENNGSGVHWMEPRDLIFAEMDFGFDSPKGISSWYTRPAVALVDTTVLRLSHNTPPDALRAALTVAGGEDLATTGAGWTVIQDGRDRERK